MAQRSAISRRDFLKLVSTSGVAALLAACYPKTSQPTPFAAATRTQMLTPFPTPTNTATIPTPSKSIRQRIEDRPFPSVFMAWNVAKNLSKGFDNDAAYYDLVITNEWQFELWWDGKYPGQGNSFVPARLEIGRAIHNRLLGNNPNFLVLAEVRYRDAFSGWLPEDSPQWERDSSGKRVPGWGDYYMLDWHDPSSRTRVATQAKAFVESGIFDGVMLDWWDDSDLDRINMLEKVRDAIGSDKLIIINSNTSKVPNSSPYVNGIYMEAAFWSQKLQASRGPSTPDDWRTISNTLLWAEANLREPHINALETWYENTPSELNRMRATITLALTHSDGYALFANNNHDHNWDPFWNHKELGKPIAVMSKRPDGAVQREFEGGTVIYNPMGNAVVTVMFAESRTSAASGETGLIFKLEAMDGDLYLKPD